MDFCAPLESAMTIYPRGLEFNSVPDGADVHGAKSFTWENKYGYAAIIQPKFGKNISAEGINEKGLGVHILYNGDAKDANIQIKKDEPIVDSFAWLQYVLGNYSSVNNIVQDIKGGKYQIYTFPVNIAGDEITLPVHFKIEDRTGNTAIIEFVDGHIKIIRPDNKGSANVMTNEPNYDEQLSNLQDVKDKGSEYYSIDNLPGGAKSQNRFVRANYISDNLPDVTLENQKNNEDGIGYMYAAINSVMVPFTNGYKCDFSSSAPQEDNWPTQWVSAMSLDQNKLYFTNEHIGNRVWVDLNKANLSKGQAVKSINLDNPNLVGDITSKLS